MIATTPSALQAIRHTLIVQLQQAVPARLSSPAVQQTLNQSVLSQ